MRDRRLMRKAGRRTQGGGFYDGRYVSVVI
jgi:hypothetical protein